MVATCNSSQLQQGTARHSSIKGWAGQVTPIRSWLYLSGARVIRPKRLQELGVTCVVNATVELPLLHIDGIEVVAARLEDHQAAVIGPHLHRVANKLEDVRKNNGCALVHCVAGVSRSPALVLAYLVKYSQLSLREAFLQLRKARPVVRPNVGFFAQLITFESEVRGSNSVRLVQVPEFGVTLPDVFDEELQLLQNKHWLQIIRARKNLENHFTHSFYSRDVNENHFTHIT